MFKSSTGTLRARHSFAAANSRRGRLRRGSAAVIAMGLALAAAVMHAPAWSQATAAAIKPDAPDRYSVKNGDTLWGISTQFLKEPWHWPELWRLNQEQVRNPHLIYPGQVLVLDRTTGTLSVLGGSASGGASGGDLAAAAGAGTAPDRNGTESLHPRIRNEGGSDSAVPSIPPNAIEPYLTRPLVIAPHDLDAGPRVVAAEEGHTTVGAGQRVYAAGLPSESVGTDWQIYRRGRPLIDPDTNKPIADEAVYVGTARVVKAGEPASLLVRDAVMEVTPEDRLMPQPPVQLINYVPHAPATNVEARVIGIYGGRGEQSYLGSGLDDDRKDVGGFDARREAGPLQVVSINRGSADGLELGDVLALFNSTWITNDRSTGPWYNGKPRTPDVQLPEERYGLLFLFRTFDHVSYGLIVQGRRPVKAGDYARKP